MMMILTKLASLGNAAPGYSVQKLNQCCHAGLLFAADEFSKLLVPTTLQGTPRAVSAISHVDPTQPFMVEVRVIQ